MSDGLGVKFDKGKRRWSLVAYDALGALVDVLDYGARKYAARNWERGMLYSRVYDANVRHLTSWWQGEECDAESGLHHLAHAMCCTMFLLAYELRRVGARDVLHPDTGEMVQADDRSASAVVYVSSMGRSLPEYDYSVDLDDRPTGDSTEPAPPGTQRSQREGGAADPFSESK